MKKNIGVLYIILAAVCWSVVGLFTKHIPWNGFTIGAMRGIIAFFAMLVLVRKMPRKLNRVKVITALCYFAQALLFVMANKYTSAANATVLQNTSPIFIMIFTAVIVKKMPRRRDIITCAVMLFGMVLSFLGNFGTAGLMGDMCAVISGVFYAGVYFCSRLPGADATESTLLGNMFYLVLIPFVLMDKSVYASGPADWGYAIALGVMLAVAWFFFSRGIRTVDSLRASFLAMLEPVLSPIWTLIFLHEVPGTWSIVGDVIVIGTLVVSNLGKKNPCE